MTWGLLFFWMVSICLLGIYWVGVVDRRRYQSNPGITLWGPNPWLLLVCVVTAAIVRFAAGWPVIAGWILGISVVALIIYGMCFLGYSEDIDEA